MWRELVLQSGAEVELGEPATAEEVESIGVRLGQSPPEDLRTLLLEMNGLADEYGTDVVWSAARVVGDNLSFRANSDFRSLYMSFEDLIFFGDNGGGDQFAFVTRGGRQEVFVWDHETDERRIVEQSLRGYLLAALGSDGEDWYAR